MLRLGSYIVRSYERTNSFRKGDNYIMKYTTWGNPYTHSQYSRTTYQKKTWRSIAVAMEYVRGAVTLSIHCIATMMPNL